MQAMLKKQVDRIIQHDKLSQVLMLLSFLITFIIARIITYLQRIGVLPNQMGPIHIHHFVPGIFIILVSGYVALSYWSNNKLREVVAVTFGLGAALVINEFSLWLFLEDNYWAERGRLNFDAITIAVDLMLLAIVISEVNDHRWIKALLQK